MPKQKLSAYERRWRYRYLRGIGVTRLDAIKLRDWSQHSYLTYVENLRMGLLRDAK